MRSTFIGPFYLTHVIRLAGNGYSVLLAVCSAICPASPICMGQNILVNE
jgi:hypothetical protein